MNGNTFQLSHFYEQPGTYQVTIEVWDQWEPGTTTVQVVVTNPPPTLSLQGGSTSEGEWLSLLGSFSSPAMHWGATVDYGDGSGEEPLLIDGTTFTLGHVYMDDGIYPVTVRVVDEYGGVGTATAQVVVHNVAPTVTAEGGAASEGALFTSSGAFTDPGQDTWTATVDYGDGSGPQPLELDVNTFILSHVYADNGVYTVLVRVQDEDGGVSTTPVQVTVENSAPVVTASQRGSRCRLGPSGPLRRHGGGYGQLGHGRGLHRALGVRGWHHGLERVHEPQLRGPGQLRGGADGAGQGWGFGLGFYCCRGSEAPRRASPAMTRSAVYGYPGLPERAAGGCAAGRAARWQGDCLPLGLGDADWLRHHGQRRLHQPAEPRQPRAGPVHRSPSPSRSDSLLHRRAGAVLAHGDGLSWPSITRGKAVCRSAPTRPSGELQDQGGRAWASSTASSSLESESTSFHVPHTDRAGYLPATHLSAWFAGTGKDGRSLPWPTSWSTARPAPATSSSSGLTAMLVRRADEPAAAMASIQFHNTSLRPGPVS